jgi:hypothetical protein
MTGYERSSASSPPQLVGRSSSGPASAAEPASRRSRVSSSAPASSDAEREVALELRRPCAHDRHPALARAGHSRVEQRALPDPGVSLDEQQVALRRAADIQQLVDGPQFRLSLEESPRHCVGLW